MNDHSEAVIDLNGRTYKTDLLVFDKDGLMFDSEQFWIELANARMRALIRHCSEADTLEWAELVGVRAKAEDKTVRAFGVVPTGILAVASPLEEMTVLAGFLTAKSGMMWNEARQLARDLFAESDQDIDLKRALKPQPGFVELMKSLNDLGIPYGVATSDTLERTRESMSMFGCWENVRFVVTLADVARGKPEPDMLRLISERQQVPPERIVMIGDSYVDVRMAAAAGCIGIGVTREPDMREKMKPYANEIVPSLEMISVRKG